MHVVIMGAGPAGLTAAVELNRHHIPSRLLEKNNQPGGLARTVVYKGYRFDIGGHRFYTKIARIQAWWQEMLGEEFLKRPRISRILYRGFYLDYPLRFTNLIARLGIVYCARAFLSYLRAVVRPRRPELSFEDWITNRFGDLLYRSFFKSYTEKVWGIPCTQLSAAWAAQRIKGLGFLSVVRSLVRARRKDPIKSLITSFYYPRFGPGQLWEKAAASLPVGSILYDHCVTGVEWEESRFIALQTKDGHGRVHRHEGDHFLSSISMLDLVRAMGDRVPHDVREAAENLSYRDFITVALIINIPDINIDNWLYIHDERVRVGRIQNYKNWSESMVADGTKTCLGLEYFCTEGDDLWSMDDAALIALATQEITVIGLARPQDVADGSVVRIEQAYPVYDAAYKTHVMQVRAFLGRFSNLQLIGRNGMHRYDNQDQAMLTAMLAVENIMGASHSVWDMNSSGEYGEE